jgi:hypothetical protein
MDRCRCWRALQRVLTRHNACPARTRLRCCRGAHCSIGN